MRFEGRVTRDKSGKYWCVEVPMLEAYTQGRNRKEAYEMIKDWVRTMLDRPDFPVDVYPGKDGAFELGSPETATLVALMLQRQREGCGLSLADMASRLGAKSRNTYARYERGSSVPTVEKLAELLGALRPGTDVVLRVVK